MWLLSLSPQSPDVNFHKKDLHFWDKNSILNI